MSVVTGAIPPRSFLSGANFTSKRGYLVAHSASADNTVVIASAVGQPVIGILSDEPTAAGRACAVQCLGVTRAVAGSGGVTRGDQIKAAADGRGVTATTSYTDTTGGAAEDPLVGSYVLGVALESAAAGEFFDIQITHAGAIARTAI